jgi:hypothetical protein
MQVYNDEVLKDLAKHKRKEKIQSLLQKMNKIGNLYGSPPQEILPENTNTRDKQSSIRKGLNPLREGHIRQEYLVFKKAAEL